MGPMEQACSRCVALCSVAHVHKEALEEQCVKVSVVAGMVHVHVLVSLMHVCGLQLEEYIHTMSKAVQQSLLQCCQAHCKSMRKFIPDWLPVNVQVQTEEGIIITLPPLDCPLQNERDDVVDDLVKSDFLHEPGWGPVPEKSTLAYLKKVCASKCGLCISFTAQYGLTT